MSISKSADPVLHTPRLTLRRAQQDDLAALFGIYGNADAMAYWATLPHADMGVTQTHLDRMMTQDPVTFFIVTRDGAVIGCAGLYRANEVGYILHPDHWNKGYVTEAMQAIIPYLFATLDVDNLMGEIDPRNTASANTLEKLGFRPTHTAQNTWCIGGVWTDSAYFTLTRP